ncbi:MAG TPA: hypothetical protein VMW55_06855 [Nitrosopumilaceae archaeon]|jgi:hypothetical protein|nr:hypothetical protein [Nitrosopumilaceae archaeon]
MNYQALIDENSWSECPVGLSGCRTRDSFFDSCDYDITVFDDKIQNDKIIQFEKSFVNIHHGSLSESNSKKLLQYDNMQIIQDDSWDLRMFLSKIKEKRSALYRDHAKNSLIESLFCCEKTKSGIKESSLFAACWQKCASYFLAEGILAVNNYIPGPSHMLDTLRKFEKNSINEKISIVNDTVGIERSTPSLLERMTKSTIGFSDIVEKNNHSLLIEKKHQHFLENSMLSDCYFYLGSINKQNFINFKDSIEKQPNLIHILKVSFDVEADSNMIEQQAKKVQKSANDILDSISR